MTYIFADGAPRYQVFRAGGLDSLRVIQYLNAFDTEHKFVEAGPPTLAPDGTYQFGSRTLSSFSLVLAVAEQRELIEEHKGYVTIRRIAPRETSLDPTFVLAYLCVYSAAIGEGQNLTNRVSDDKVITNVREAEESLLRLVLPSNQMSVIETISRGSDRLARVSKDLKQWAREIASDSFYPNSIQVRLFVAKIVEEMAREDRRVVPERVGELLQMLKELDKSRPDRLIGILGRPYEENPHVDVFKDFIEDIADLEAADVIPDAEPASGSPAPGDSQPVTEAPMIGPFGLPRDGLPKEDSLGYKRYADALAKVVAHASTETPLSIAISGPWGRGKTALLHYIQKATEALYSESNSNFVSTKYIEVNAWQLSKTNRIWAEFYSKVIDDTISKIDSRCSRFLLRIEYAWRSSAMSLVFIAALTLVFLALFLLGVAVATTPVLSLVFKLSSGAVLVSAAIKIWQSRLLEGTTRHILSRLNRLRHDAALGDEKETLDRIELVGRILKRYLEPRIVVVIEDLDRCSKEKVLEILEAIQLMFRDQNYVFLLGMDADVVCNSVGANFGYLSTPFKDIGRGYIEKVVQILFHLPRLSSEQNIDFYRTLCSGIAPEMKVSAITESDATSSTRDAEASPEDDRTNDRVPNEPTVGEEVLRNARARRADKSMRLTQTEYLAITTLGQVVSPVVSPRLMKRFVNTYSFARQLLVERAQITGADLTNTLEEDFVYWMALNIYFPQESADLVRVITGEVEVNSNAVDEWFFRTGKFKDGDVTELHSEFVHFVMHILWKWEWKRIIAYLPISDCFNYARQ